MARPRIDVEAERARMLRAADALLRRTRGSGFSVSALAAECGMSQSNAYRFFPSKAALLEALAARWFADVEEAVDAAVAEARDPESALRAFLETHLRAKRAKYKADPELFSAYLALARKAPAAVRGPVGRLEARMGALVAQLCPEDPDAARMAADLTVQIRNPYLLEQAGGEIGDQRLAAVIDGVIAALRSRRAG